MPNPFRQPSLASGASATSINKSPSLDQTQLADAPVASSDAIQIASPGLPLFHPSASRDRGYGFGRNDSFHGASLDRTEYQSENVHTSFHRGESGRSQDAISTGTGEAPQR